MSNGYLCTFPLLFISEDTFDIRKNLLVPKLRNKLQQKLKKYDDNHVTHRSYVSYNIYISKLKIEFCKELLV